MWETPVLSMMLSICFLLTLYGCVTIMCHDPLVGTLASSLCYATIP